VPGVIEDLVARKVRGLYVIKSTVPPGTTQGLMDKYHIHICHNPEFLRENSSFEDVLNPTSIVIGQCCQEHAAILQQLYAPLKCPIILTRPTVSETVKVTLNSYLATLISFWNQIDEISRALGIDTHEVARICNFNPRVSAYGTEFFGSAFGGKCLPKDLDQLINTGHQAGIKSQLLEAIKVYNRTLHANPV
jgi:UDPglucose 6-dehydrogenase